MLRFVSSGIALPIVVGATWGGGLWFAGLILLVIGIVMLELGGLLRRAGYGSHIATGLLAAAAPPVWAVTGSGELALGALALAVIGGLGAVLARTARGGELLGWALHLALGLYVGVLLAPTILLRQSPDGLWWIALVLLGTWCCDIAAYVAGRRWGKRPLAPAVSPNKTVEGLAGGVLAAVVIPLAVLLVWSQPPLRMLGFGLVVATGAVFGDLIESAIKRQLNVKDAGWIMVGHGGLLDRIDSLLLAGFLGSLYVAATEGVGQ